jgi:hypothetical protein
MFHKFASIQILSVVKPNGSFVKRASKKGQLTQEEQADVKTSINLIRPELVKSLAGLYNISPKVSDYIFVVARALTSDVPNQNGDCFTEKELTRFSSQHKCQVFETFRNCPIHVEHCASDPKTARGFIPDCSFNTKNANDKHVLCLVAVDTTKDKPLSQGLLEGKINSFSMGCTCQEVECSVCAKIAKNDRDLCEHLQYHKMRTIQGKKVYEVCHGVEYQELSVVGVPADPTALTQQILRAASRQVQSPDGSKWSAIASMLSDRDQVELALFAQKNLDALPESLLKLLVKLY